MLSKIAKALEMFNWHRRITSSMGKSVATIMKVDPNQLNIYTVMCRINCREEVVV